MNSNNTVRDKVTVHFLLSFRQLCLVTVSLPLGGLVLCFITAYIFQPDEIHETHCRVRLVLYCIKDCVSFINELVSYINVLALSFLLDCVV